MTWAKAKPPATTAAKIPINDGTYFFAKLFSNSRRAFSSSSRWEQRERGTSGRCSQSAAGGGSVAPRMRQEAGSAHHTLLEDKVLARGHCLQQLRQFVQRRHGGPPLV